MQSNEVYTVSV